MADFSFGRVTWFDAKTFGPRKSTKQGIKPEENLGESIPNAHTQTVTAVRFAPDGAWALTAGKDGAVHLWDPDTQSVVRTIRNEGGVPFLDACFTPDSKWVVTGDGDGEVRAWPIDPLPVAEDYLRAHAVPRLVSR
jgi:WD40 repeat protein